MSQQREQPAPPRTRRPSSRRTYRVAAKRRECDLIVSLDLVPVDGEPLRPFMPGQHLTFSLAVPGERRPLIRNYSFADCPEETDHYRITVKKEPPPPDQPELPPGIGSLYLHDTVQVGDELEAIGPRGEFHLLMESTRPVVLLSGGVGLAPMVSMFKHLAQSDSPRPVWYIHGCQTGQLHALRDDIRGALASNPNSHAVTFYDAPGPDDVQGEDYDYAGFITAEHLSAHVPDIAKAECYVCGPAPFMQAMYRTLIGLGVGEEQILYEFFGPSTVLKGE